MNTDANVTMLPPEGLLAAENIRYDLKKYRIKQIAESIKALGGIQTPLKVEPLPQPGPHGEQYMIREGHYRQAAALELNKEGAGVLCPCIVEEPKTAPADRVKLQISENMDRENLSPMDMAIAIKKLLDAGIPRVEIRNLFSRPGGRKGLAMQPLSFSMLAIYLSFLDFPKNIQSKIHEGTLGVAAAYKLTKAPREKWQSILADAEAQRQAEIESEEKQEARYLEEERRAAEQEAKAKEDAEALKISQELAAKAQQESKARAEKAAEQYKILSTVPPKAKDEKKQAEEAFKAAEADAKAADKIAAEALATAQKLQEKAERNVKLAAERAAKLADARKEAARKTSPKPEQIERATAKVTGGPVALSAGDMRKLIADNSLPGSFPKTQKVFQAIGRAFAGVTTDQQCLSEVAYIVGERKERPKHMAKEPKDKE